RTHNRSRARISSVKSVIATGNSNARSVRLRSRTNAGRKISSDRLNYASSRINSASVRNRISAGNSNVSRISNAAWQNSSVTSNNSVTGSSANSNYSNKDGWSSGVFSNAIKSAYVKTGCVCKTGVTKITAHTTIATLVAATTSRRASTAQTSFARP